MRLTVLLKVTILSGILFAGLHCRSDLETANDQFILKVRIAGEPDNLHPMFSSSTYSTTIESLIYLPLVEYDPYTLELTPLLVKERAAMGVVDSGEFAGATSFTYEIRPEAQWADGKAITAEDYVFTLKAVFNPKVDAQNWISYLKFIESVETDPQDPRKFTVIVPTKYMLSEIVTCNFNIFPKHLCDPKGYLANIALADLLNEDVAATLAETNPLLDSFAVAFSNAFYSRDVVPGSGPYTLDRWDTGESLILSRDPDWWGYRVEDPPTLLHAYADKVVFQIIPDESTALTALKDGQIDLITEISAKNFLDLKADPAASEKFDFHTPALMQYNYLEVNNRLPELQDPRVRKALAHVVDYDALSENVSMGLSRRTIGPFHPDKPYYNNNLKPLEYDIAAAKALLQSAGWSDTNQDGTVDKVIDGKRTELVLEITVTAREEGRKIALILKQNAALAGIGIEIKPVEDIFSKLEKLDFELAPAQRRTYPALNDPYANWHSETNRPGGKNYAGFSNPRVDSIIEDIRFTTSEAQRNARYLELQEIIYEEQPRIFLYVPLERIITTKSLDFTPSPRRPGYFVNLIRKKQNN